MSNEETWPPQRRAEDQRITRIEDRVQHLEEIVEKHITVEEPRAARFELMLAENTKITNEVRDILGTFKVTGKIAKWVASILAAIGGAWAFVEQIFNRG